MEISLTNHNVLLRRVHITQQHISASVLGVPMRSIWNPEITTYHSKIAKPMMLLRLASMSGYIRDPSHYAKFSNDAFRGLFTPLYAKLPPCLLGYFIRFWVPPIRYSQTHAA